MIFILYIYIIFIFYVICDISINFRLKPLDIEFMKQLHNKVNIVPVIAKADCLTKKEVQRLKTRVSCTTIVTEYINSVINNILIYSWSLCCP